jgi:hypothetical protein
MCGGGSSAPQIQETADQVEQAKINEQLWNYYQTKYRPNIEAWSKKVTDPEVQAEEERKVGGQINAEVMKNIDPANATVNPVQNTKQLNKLATVGTGAQVQGQGGVRSKQIKDTQNIIDIGRGQATEAVAGIGDIASRSLSAEIADVELEQQKQAAIENSYGSMAGAVAAGLLRNESLTKDPKPVTRVLNYNLTNDPYNPMYWT